MGHPWIEVIPVIRTRTPCSRNLNRSNSIGLPFNDLNSSQSLQLTIFAAGSIEEGEGLLSFFERWLTTDTKTNSRDSFAASIRIQIQDRSARYWPRQCIQGPDLPPCGCFAVSPAKMCLNRAGYLNSKPWIFYIMRGMRWQSECLELETQTPKWRLKTVSFWNQKPGPQGPSKIPLSRGAEFFGSAFADAVRV